MRHNIEGKRGCVAIQVRPAERGDVVVVDDNPHVAQLKRLAASEQIQQHNGHEYAQSQKADRAAAASTLCLPVPGSSS